MGNTSSIGPSVACDRYCGFTGTQMLCGGGQLDKGLPPAVSLYCSLPYEEKRVKCDQDRSLDDVSLEKLTSKMRDTMLALEGEAIRQNTQSHGILVVLCAILTICVVYICVSRGLAFLIRESA